MAYRKFKETYPEEEVQKIEVNETVSTVQPKVIQKDTIERELVLPQRDNDIVDLLDRFEILYGDKLSTIRRFYNTGHLLDLLKMIGDENLRPNILLRKNHLVCLDI